MFDAFRDYQIFTRLVIHLGLTAQFYLQAAADCQEQLVLMLVTMPDKRTPGLCKFDVRFVDFLANVEGPIAVFDVRLGPEPTLFTLHVLSGSETSDYEVLWDPPGFVSDGLIVTRLTLVISEILFPLFGFELRFSGLPGRPFARPENTNNQTISVKTGCVGRRGHHSSRSQRCNRHWPR